ncbi:hypothetical protein DAPPUDRAFT_116974 [Daphnia pulex]|uniref:Uncharacterized protein n=1 Tax=Daphnia pulex TaxID=6669 RepID=E9HR53_DAPPU|nr:hypothetical protein DAPPUDRAFT_116974 [Daphnia pulex]|eukprot:EFX65781.1 hypothetical protein DAPPUDRAFT_116974 [Daphnia pulex]
MGLLGDVVNQVVNSVPIVGHIKGMVHYACGDTERGDAAVRSATRTKVVLGAGVAGAVAAATAAGAAADLTFYANGEPQLHGIARVIKTPRKSQSWLVAGINVLGDGCLGVSLENRNAKRKRAATETPGTSDDSTGRPKRPKTNDNKQGRDANTHQAISGSSGITDIRMEAVFQESRIQQSYSIVTNALASSERAPTVHSSTTLEKKTWNFSGKHSAEALAEIQRLQGSLIRMVD